MSRHKQDYLNLWNNLKSKVVLAVTQFNQRMMNMTGQHQVKQDQPSTGTVPASSIVQGSDDSKFMFKKGQKVFQRNATVYDFYAAILSGTRDEINGVINQSQNNTYDYTSYDVNTYTGKLAAPVAAWEAAHPRPATKPQ
jgi:hypothetical protein